MAVSEVERWLQEQFAALKACKDREEALYFKDELVKEAKEKFHKDYYEIDGLADDIFEEEFDVPS